MVPGWQVVCNTARQILHQQNRRRILFWSTAFDCSKLDSIKPSPIFARVTCSNRSIIFDGVTASGDSQPCDTFKVRLAKVSSMPVAIKNVFPK